MAKTEEILRKDYGFKKKYLAGEYFLQKKLKHPYLKTLFLVYEDGVLYIDAFDCDGGMFRTMYICKYSLKKLQEILAEFTY